MPASVASKIAKYKRKVIEIETKNDMNLLKRKARRYEYQNYETESTQSDYRDDGSDREAYRLFNRYKRAMKGIEIFENISKSDITGIDSQLRSLSQHLPNSEMIVQDSAIADYNISTGSYRSATGSDGSIRVDTRGSDLSNDISNDIHGMVMGNETDGRNDHGIMDTHGSIGIDLARGKSTGIHELNERNVHGATCINSSTDLGNNRSTGIHGMVMGNEPGDRHGDRTLCINCLRSQNRELLHHVSQNPKYNLVFERHPRNTMRRKKLRFAKGSRNDTTNVTLCFECSKYLEVTGNIINHTDLNKFAWPSFIWNLLSNTEVRHVYGERLWRFIPRIWRYWWLGSVKTLFPETYQNVDLDLPEIYFVDRTIDYDEMKNDILSQELPRIASTLNKFLIPDVLCPWGESEYLLKTGFVGIDVIYQRFLGKVRIKMISDYSEIVSVLSARDDYLRESREYDNWLLNPRWKVVPTLIILNEKGPVICTSRHHDGGTKKAFLHLPRETEGDILPSSIASQLSHIVPKCQVIKPMMAHKYSNSYQMNKQTGGFQGVSSIGAVDVGNFSSCSILLDKFESRSITFRPDINAHLEKLCEEKILFKESVVAKREDSKRLYPNPKDYEKYLNGSTYVSLADAIKMQKYIGSDNLIDVVWDNRGEGNPDICLRCRRHWPSNIFICQKLDRERYGVMFPSLPYVKTDAILSNTSKTVYVVCALLITVKEIWAGTDSISPLRQSEWHGWALSFLASKCFSMISRPSDKTNPFKKAFVRNMIDMEKYFMSENVYNLSSIFNRHGGVSVYNHLEIDIESGEHQERDILVFNGIDLLDEDEILQDVVSIDGTNFELRTIITMEDYEVTLNHRWKWRATVYCRHGGIHLSWWKQGTSVQERFPIQVENNWMMGADLQKTICCVYVKKTKIDTTSLRNEYLKYIGGQIHIQCYTHKLPLICSYPRDRQCIKCQKKESFSCPDLNCCVCLCKTCFENQDNDRDIVYINETNIAEENHVDSSDVSTDSSNECDVFENEDDETCEESYEWGDDDSFIGDTSSCCSRESSDDEVDLFLETMDEERIDTLLINGGTSYETLYGVEDDESSENNEDWLPTTNAGDLPIEIKEKQGIGRHVSGHVILNQIGSLLSRQKHKIRSFSGQKHFLQRLCSTIKGESIPLAFPDAMLFPSIFWHMIPDINSYPGAIPSSLLNDKTSKHGIASIRDHVLNRMTLPCSTTSTCPRYIAYCYDMLSNLTMVNEDSRIVMNRGFTVDTTSATGLSVRSKTDSSLFESVDSKQMVKNLSASQKHHKMDFFLTFTCNQSKHFGVCCLKQWIDSNEWEKHYNNFDQLENIDKNEIRRAVHQAAGPLILRNWLEVRKYFIQYLLHSPSSPYINVSAIFARDEYQAEVGNLPHIHLMLAINWEQINDTQRDSINDLIRASICDIVRVDEVDSLIAEGVLKSIDDLKEIQRDAEVMLTHKCTQRCLMRIKVGNGPDSFRCRKPNNLKLSPDNTKNTLKPLYIQFSSECKERLRRIGLARGGVVDDNGWEDEFVCEHPFFSPKRHIPATNPTLDMNISPVEPKTFTICRSMQNIQSLTHSNGCNKYVVKYVGKVDKGSNVIFSCDPARKGAVEAEFNFLHNTKQSTSAIMEDKEYQRKRNRDHPSGRAISQNEMLQHILGYNEIHTNLVYVAIPTLPFELRPGVEKQSHNQNSTTTVSDGAYAGLDIDLIRRSFRFHEWRQLRAPEQQIIHSCLQSSLSIDRISLFSCRPPELRSLIAKLDQYYRWFYILPKVQKRNEIELKLHNDIRKSIWIDGFCHQIKLRVKAVDEVCDHLLLEQNISLEQQQMRDLFFDIQYVLKIHAEGRAFNNTIQQHLFDFAHEELLHREETDHLPVPVFSFIKPTMGPQFLLHILLSMGKFLTEVDLTMHRSLRDAFRYAKLIGRSDDLDDLKQYSNQLLRRFIEEQLVFFPNSMRVIDRWICEAGFIFDAVIIENVIPICNLPPVQQTQLDEAMQDEINKIWKSKKTALITAARNELSTAIGRCSIPSQSALQRASKENPLDWNAVEAFTMSPEQSLESFLEQKLAIENSIDGIHRLIDVFSSSTFNKCRITHGSAGSGKSFIMQYVLLYALSKGLNTISTAVMARRANQIGGTHVHELFCLDAKNWSPHRHAELAILKLLSKPVKLYILCTLEVLCLDEAGQTSAELLSTLDIILRRVRKNNTFFGGVLLLGTMDHMQLPPVRGLPFLVSSHMMSCFQMVRLKQSVRAQGDLNYMELQNIARMLPKEYTPMILQRFRNLCKDVFTFVDSWEDGCIDRQTVRLYGLKLPGREATLRFIESVKQSIETNEFVERYCDDVQNQKYSHQEWMPATNDIKTKLDAKVKEPRAIIFFRGALFEFTYNDQVRGFTQSSLCVLFSLPSRESVDQFQRIKVLAAPPGIKDHTFDQNKTLDEYVKEGWFETYVHTAPERPISMGNGIQAQRRQYGMKHRVTSTIHGSMGDTLPKVAIQLCQTDKFKWWSKEQVIVGISRTKLGKDTIFVGDQTSTIQALCSLIQQKNQWTDYMENVLNIISINNDPGQRDKFIFHSTTYPYRIRDMPLPDCNTGFVYMLVSCKDATYTYIGETKNIRRRLQQHNSGYGSQSTCPSHLRPFAVFALICGFDGNKQLQTYVEKLWKEKRDHLKQMGTYCIKQWALGANDIISSFHFENFAMHSNQLRLLLYFQQD